MTKPEEQTAYAQFLAQAQQEQQTQRPPTPGFLKFRDIVNELFEIAKKETTPVVTNRFLYACIAAVALVIFGHIIIQAKSGLLLMTLENDKLEFESTVAAIDRLPDANLARLQIGANQSLQSDKALVQRQTMWVQIGAGVLSLLTILNSLVAYRRAIEKLNDSNFFERATEATHNFMLWKLRSPTNASEYNVFHEFDQIESDDIDFGQLRKLFSNVHYTANRRGMLDYFLAPIAALPVLFIPVYGLGLYCVIIGLGVSLATRRHVGLVGAFNCLGYLPAPVTSPHSQDEMVKTDQVEVL